MGCHGLSCFPCREVMRCGRSGHNAVSSAGVSGFFSGVFRLRFRGIAFLPFAPVPFPPLADGGTLIRAYPARAPARVGAGAVRAPDCPGAPPRASRPRGARLPSAPRRSLRTGAAAGGLRMTPAAALSGGERVRCQAEKRIISNIANIVGFALRSTVFNRVSCPARLFCTRQGTRNSAGAMTTCWPGWRRLAGLCKPASAMAERKPGRPATRPNVSRRMV